LASTLLNLHQSHKFRQKRLDELQLLTINHQLLFSRRTLDIYQMVNASVHRATIQDGCSGKEEEKATTLKTHADLAAADALP
jgi:hypothetical protein